jgi:hypothetical protein
MTARADVSVRPTVTPPVLARSLRWIPSLISSAVPAPDPALCDRIRLRGMNRQAETSPRTQQSGMAEGPLVVRRIVRWSLVAIAVVFSAWLLWFAAHWLFFEFGFG